MSYLKPMNCDFHIPHSFSLFEICSNKEPKEKRCRAGRGIPAVARFYFLDLLESWGTSATAPSYSERA